MLVWNKKTVAAAAADSVDPERWSAEFETAFGQVAGRFARRDAAGGARDLLTGLVAPFERKNCWTIAEHVGHTSPHRLQHLLGRAVWDADGARDDVRGYVISRLADPGAVLVVDETGDLKKGASSVGVQRQYSGTAGRVKNCQVAVFLTYAATGGHAFLDRCHGRAGVVPVLDPATGSGPRPGPRRRTAMDDRGELPGRQGPRRSRWAPGPPLDSWHRWTTLAMLAHAFLTILAVVMNEAEPDQTGLIAVTLAEARRLFTTLLARTAATTEQILSWSAGDDVTSTEPAPPTTADAKPQATAPIYGCSTSGRS